MSTTKMVSIRSTSGRLARTFYPRPSSFFWLERPLFPSPMFAPVDMVTARVWRTAANIRWKPWYVEAGYPGQPQFRRSIKPTHRQGSERRPVVAPAADALVAVYSALWTLSTSDSVPRYVFGLHHSSFLLNMAIFRLRLFFPARFFPIY